MQAAVNYINHNLNDNGDLHITFDQSGLADITEEFNQHPEWDSNTKLTELLTPMLQNGWEQIRPQDIEVKSNVFILSEDVERDEHAKRVYVGTVYWYPEHLFINPVEELLTYGEVTFLGVSDTDDIDALERRNRKFKKQGCFNEFGKLYSHTLLGGYTLAYYGDGVMFCSDCALHEPKATMCTTYDEGPTMECDGNCGTMIESSYGDPDAPIHIVLHFNNGTPDYSIWIEKDDFETDSKTQDAVVRICESDNIDHTAITHWTKVEDEQ